MKAVVSCIWMSLVALPNVVEAGEKNTSYGLIHTHGFFLNRQVGSTGGAGVAVGGFLGLTEGPWSWGLRLEGSVGFAL